MKTAIDAHDDGGEGDALWQLIDLTRERRMLLRETERREAELVRRARHEEYSWQQIAAALGVSKQAVHKKYGRR